MSQWRMTPLSAVCEINPRQNGAERLAPETSVSFVPMSAVDETGGYIAAMEARSLESVSRGYTPFQNDDVLFAKITPCMENGKAAIARELVNGVGFGSTEFHVLRAKADVIPEWVFAFVRQPAFRKLAKANFTGTAGQQRVPADFLKRALIPIPPLPEQERIARVLDEVAALRRLRAQADDHTTALLPALFGALFSQKGYPCGHLGDLSLLITSGLTPRGGEEVYQSTGPYFIRSQNVLMNRLDLSSAVCLPAEVHRQMIRTHVSEGDVLLNITGASIGRVTWVERLNREANVSQHVCLIRPKPDVVNATYLSVFLSLPSTQHYILQVQAGASRQALNHQQVRALEIPLPPISLQRTFAARVTEVREMEFEQVVSGQRLNDLCASLLDRAFEGEL